MKRLVTQFDTERTRATVATPTCCCCCCCCVGSVLTATALATIDTQHAAGEAGEPPAVRGLYGFAGFLALPLALLAAAAAGYALSFVDGALAGLASIGAFFAAWIGILTLIYRRLASPRGIKAVALIVCPTTLLFGLEFFVGFALVNAGGGSGAVYLLLAAALPFVAVPLVLWVIRS